MAHPLEAFGGPPAPEGGIVCWSVPLDVTADVLTTVVSWLDAAELARAERYHFEHHRRRFIARRAARRRILGSFLQVPPSQVFFREVGTGKPELEAADPARRPIHFSASHSEEVAVVAVSGSAPIGVDVEVHRLVESSLWEVRHLFSESERLALERVSERERVRLFFDCWTRKEACVKADGAGLSIDLDSYEVPVGNLNGGVSVALEGVIPEQPRKEVRLISLPLGDEISGALAVVGNKEPCLEVRGWDWSEALRV
ncbi:MAG: 4'-phosphopantetheinyl transferase superfamily protein [Limisphaerales bacterium]